MGLAGMGDLVLTLHRQCLAQSPLRPFAGAWRGSADQARSEIGQVVEGVDAAEEVMRAAERAGVEMRSPNRCTASCSRAGTRQRGVRVLMEREPKAETD